MIERFFKRHRVKDTCFHKCANTNKIQMYSLIEIMKDE